MTYEQALQNAYIRILNGARAYTIARALGEEPSRVFLWLMMGVL